VTRLVRRLSAWSNDSDDLVQDVLVTAIVKRKTFHAHARLETWITRITINRCRTHQRKQWLRSKLFRAWAERHAPSRLAAKTPEDFAAADERAATVRAAIAQLPAPSREAIVLCYLEGLTVAAAAEALTLRRGTLEVRLSRARAQLREALAGTLDEHFANASE
jgi:RNA polymerase sigma-70 factor (ECF subfamily)